jgi:hypothetical protein
LLQNSSPAKRLVHGQRAAVAAQQELRPPDLAPLILLVIPAPAGIQ